MGTLTRASRRLVCLRVVHDDQGRADLLTIPRPLEAHAADPAGNARGLDDGPARLRARHGGIDNLLGRPPDMRPDAFKCLPVAPMRNPFEHPNRVADLGEVLVEQIVRLQFGLDRLQRLQRRALIRPDE
jgi:hypothetical protein